MDFQTKNVDKFTLELQFTCTPKEYAAAEDKAYERAKGKYSVQGFRKGKVPKKVIQQNYGDGVFFQDTFAELADQAYGQFLDQNPDIRTFGEPSLDLLSFVDQVVVGKIVLKVLGSVQLGQYKGLKVSAILNEFTPQMVEDELLHAQAHHTHSHPAEGKVAELGDIVVIDFIGSVDGVEFDGGKAEGYELELGSHSFVDTFEDQLVGHKAGEHVTVSVTFPDNYGAKALAGKVAKFECDVRSVNTKHIPDIDDELARHVAGVDTLDEWKKQIEEQVRHELEHKNQSAKEDAILAQIVDNSEVDLPAEVVDEQLDVVMRDLSQRLAYQGMRLEDYATYIGSTVEALRAERRDDAERIAKTKQVLEALVRAEDLIVSDIELDAKIEEIAKMSNMTTKEYKKSMDNRRLNYLYSDILMSKLMAVLLSENEVVPSSDGEVSAPKKAAKKATTKAAGTKKATETQTAKKAKSTPTQKASTTKAKADSKATAAAEAKSAATKPAKTATKTAKATSTKSAATKTAEPAAKKATTKAKSTAKSTKTAA